MLRIKFGSFIIVLNLLLITTVFSQNDRENTSLNYKEFIPKWSKGDSWYIEVFRLSLEKNIPTRNSYGRARMTVIQTPADGSGNYVISIVADDKLVTTPEKVNMFITLDQNDLSLLELKSVSQTDANEVRVKKYPSHRIKEISVGMLSLVFPALSSEDNPDYKNTHYDLERGYATKASTTTFEGKDTLVVYGVRREWEKEDFLRRFNEEGYNYRLLWKKGDPWWTSQTYLPDGQNRIELVQAAPELRDANSMKEKFVILYNRYKIAHSQGKIIESDEIYYDIVKLGKEAVPYIIDNIKVGDKNLVTALSEITGLVPRNATMAKSLDWWERNKKRWNVSSEK